jgi:hypothetical protein
VRVTRHLVATVAWLAGCHAVSDPSPLDPCVPVAPTCDDGTSAAVFDAFSANGVCTHDISGGVEQWPVFADAFAVIVHVTAIHDGVMNGTASAGVVGQFGALGITDCGGTRAGQICTFDGTVTAPWLRWTIVGVDASGPAVALAASNDATTWTEVGATDQIGEVFNLTAGVSCGLAMPPIPCDGLQLELSDAIFTCPATP